MCRENFPSFSWSSVCSCRFTLFLSSGGGPSAGSFLAVYLVGAALFVVALGYPVGGVGYGLLIFVHASSVILLEGTWLREATRFMFRLALAAVTLLAVWLLMYAAVNRILGAPPGDTPEHSRQSRGLPKLGVAAERQNRRLGGI